MLRTPLRESSWLSTIAGGAVRLKLETLQPTFSYKIRGAFNTILRLIEEHPDQRQPLVTASAGNHGTCPGTRGTIRSLPAHRLCVRGAHRK